MKKPGGGECADNSEADPRPTHEKTALGLASDAPLSPEDIDAQFRRLVLQGVADLL